MKKMKKISEINLIMVILSAIVVFSSCNSVLEIKRGLLRENSVIHQYGRDYVYIEEIKKKDSGNYVFTGHLYRVCIEELPEDFLVNNLIIRFTTSNNTGVVKVISFEKTKFIPLEEK